jgi:hypothetical protein
MEHIKIVNWEGFQHYRYRNPPWIKLHNSLLESYEFEHLPDDSKLLLLCLWMLASRMKTALIPNDLDFIKKKLPIKSEINLQPLIDNGFILILSSADSKLIADCKQNADTEKSRVEKSRGNLGKTLKPFARHFTTEEQQLRKRQFDNLKAPSV